MQPRIVNRIEKGAPMVAIGIYLRVLYVLQLDDDILWLVTVSYTHLDVYKRQARSKAEMWKMFCNMDCSSLNSVKLHFVCIDDKV